MLQDLGVIEVGGEAVARILALDEGHFLDFKARELDAAKLSVHAAAFANSAGGEIFVGIDEHNDGTKAWRGFDDMEDANSHLQVLHEIFQGNNIAAVEFLNGVGVPGTVLHIIIEKSRDIVQTSQKEIYVRVGAQKLPVRIGAHEEIVRLQYDKGLATFEDMPLKDVPVEIIADSYTVTEFMIAAVPTSEPAVWLRSQRLVVDDSPTAAAVLLFADEPQAILPKRSAIKILRYRSTGVEGHRDQLDGDPLTIEGPLTAQIAGAVVTTKKIVEETAVQTQTGLQKVSYPEETLHEIIANAVLHRDYSIATDVQVRIFDNRIEVESPGTLPGHVTEENVLQEQFARNGKIVRLINKFPNPPNKDVGEGLNTAFKKMRDIGLRPPVLREQDKSVLVEIRHERLASHEEQILEYLSTHGEINNSKARELTGEGSENKMKRVFERMMDAGQIHRDPLRRGSATAYLSGPAPAAQPGTMAPAPD